MKKKLAIIGAGGHGKVCADIALKMKSWDDIVFLDNSKKSSQVLRLDVIDVISNWHNYKTDYDFFVALGNNRTREMMIDELENGHATIATLIHPSAILGEEVVVNQGTVIAAGVIVNSFSTIGKGVILNTACTVDHDNQINDFVHISPGAHLAGTVRVGRRSWIGIGSIIRNNTDVCDDVVVGAGGVVIKDIYENGTYFGVPVRRK